MVSRLRTSLLDISFSGLEILNLYCLINPNISLNPEALKP